MPLILPRNRKTLWGGRQGNGIAASSLAHRSGPTAVGARVAEWLYLDWSSRAEAVTGHFVHVEWIVLHDNPDFRDFIGFSPRGVGSDRPPRRRICAATFFVGLSPRTLLFEAAHADRTSHQGFRPSEGRARGGPRVRIRLAPAVSHLRTRPYWRRPPSCVSPALYRSSRSFVPARAAQSQRGTHSSNPPPSSGESRANLTSSMRSP
jgi:hypothetical protein